MQTIQTTTEETTIAADSTEGAARTIAELIADRDARYQQEEDARKSKEEAEHMAWMQKQHNAAARFILETMPAELRNALAPFTIRWIKNTDGLYTLTGNHPVAVFTYGGEEWSIDTCNTLLLRGPSEYTYNLGYYSILDDVLRGLEHYPEWLAERDEADQREAERLAQAERDDAAEVAAIAEEAKKPRHYTGTEGNNAKYHLIHKGAYVTVWYASYYGEYTPSIWGTVEAWDKRWLLLTLDKGAQQLIAWRHVATVEPLDKEPEQPATADNLAHYPGMTSDNVPF